MPPVQKNLNYILTPFHYLDNDPGGMLNSYSFRGIISFMAVTDDKGP
jgi:hypothetical protein